MGVCQVLSCNSCKKFIDLNKNRSVPSLWINMPFYKELDPIDIHYIQISFRFMRRHWGHDVQIYSDHDDGPEYGYSFNYENEDYTKKEK